MPDISKLKELSEIFGVTVDEILGGGTHSELVRELIEKQPVRKATREEIEEIAPILHEAQVETLLNGSDRCEADIDMVASLAPYLSQAYIDRYALSLLNKYNTFRAIGRIAPFVSTSVLEEKAAELVKRSGSLDVLEPVMPFLSSELLDRLADAFYEKNGSLSSLSPILPFISTAKCNAFTELAYREHGPAGAAQLAPFAGMETLNRIAAETLEKEGIAALTPLLPFIDSRILEDFLNNRTH